MFVNYDDDYNEFNSGLNIGYSRANHFAIEEQNTIVGAVDIVGIVLNIMEWPQLEIRIMVYKAYVGNPEALYKYSSDILELLEYETGAYMQVESVSISDNFGYWQMDIELHYSY